MLERAIRAWRRKKKEKKKKKKKISMSLISSKLDFCLTVHHQLGKVI